MEILNPYTLPGTIGKVKRKTKKSIPLNTIEEIICITLSLKLEDLRVLRGSNKKVDGKFLFAYFAYMLNLKSKPKITKTVIGKYVGKNHCFTIHAVKKTKELFQGSPNFKIKTNIVKFNLLNYIIRNNY